MMSFLKNSFRLVRLLTLSLFVSPLVYFAGDAMAMNPIMDGQAAQRAIMQPMPGSMSPSDDGGKPSGATIVMPTIDKPLKEGDKVNIDFNDVGIKLFIKFIAEISGLNFVIDEKVKGNVTIISPKKVTVGEAMKVFESTLEVYGYSLVKAGNITKVIPATEARHRGPFDAGEKGDGDRIVTRLIPLKNVNAQELVNILRPLIPPTSFITGYSRTNTLILADYASNIEKILGIVGQLDSPSNEEIITVTHLKYAGAKELAGRLEKIFAKSSPGPIGRGRPSPIPGKGKPRTPRGAGPAGWGQDESQIIYDDRINAIIIIASKSQTDSILSLIEKLDVVPPAGRGRINVYYLKNADAEELSKVLNNITKSQSNRPGRPKGAPRGSFKLQDKVTITPDKATNSLVITAAVEDYETIKEVIEKLDKRRRQVFVEALIIEVTTDSKREFGIEWRTTNDFTESGLKAIGGVSSGTIEAVAENPLNTPAGLTIGVVDGVINFAGKEFLNLGALMHALKTETGINILSTPNIMTTDNEEAEIIVAQNVPFVTGQSQNTGGTTLTTIERKNIGITLRIKPQISESNEVKLSVYQEISSISPTQLEKAQDLITFTRSIKTTVIVSDKQNIVIGGLMRDDLNDSESKVPFLGDIPLFGWLFKSEIKQKQKTNLLVFLRPHIIRNEKDIASLTDKSQERLNVNPADYYIDKPRVEKKEPENKPEDEWDTEEESW